MNIDALDSLLLWLEENEVEVPEHILDALNNEPDAIDVPEISLDEPVGKLIEKLFELKREQQHAARELKNVQANYDMLAGVILSSMEGMGTDMLKIAGVGSVSIAATEFVSVADWPTLETFILNHGMTHLLQRRVASKAAKELLTMGYFSENGQHVPDFNTVFSVGQKRKLSVRAA